RLAARWPDQVRVIVAVAQEALHIFIEVVIQARAQHVLAKIGALQADQARAARIAQPGNIRTRAWEAILPRHQAVLLRALSADEQKRLVLDHRAARAKSKLLPAVIRGARRKPRCAKHLVTKIAKQI